MDINIYFSFIVATTIILIIPGPTIITVITQSINHGRKSSIPLILGVFMGDLVAMSLSFFGLGALLKTSALLFGIFKWIGAAYLVYLGIKMWLSKENSDVQKTEEHNKSGFALFQTTFLVTVLNPKSIAFFVAFFPQFIDPNQLFHLHFFILGCTFLTLAMLNATLYSIFAVRLGSVVKQDHVQKWFKRISGSVLICAGIITATIKES